MDAKRYNKGKKNYLLLPQSFHLDFECSSTSSSRVALHSVIDWFEMSARLPKYLHNSDINLEGGLLEVLEFGAKKYGEHNWKLGMTYSSIVQSALRHMIAIQSGERDDGESGLSHVHHYNANVMMIRHYVKYPDLYKKYDDRAEYSGSSEGED